MWRDGCQWPVPICGCLLCQKLWGLLGWSWCGIRALDPARIHLRPCLTWCFLPSCPPFHLGHQGTAVLDRVVIAVWAPPRPVAIPEVGAPVLSHPLVGLIRGLFVRPGVLNVPSQCLGGNPPFQSPQVGCAPDPAGLLGFPTSPGMDHLCFIQNNKVFTKDTESFLGLGTT